MWTLPSVWLRDITVTLKLASGNETVNVQKQCFFDHDRVD